jgi:hypothetical protein
MMLISVPYRLSTKMSGISIDSVTAKVRACLMAGKFIFFPPNASPRITKDEIINKKLNKEISARTTGNRSTKADETHVLVY